MYNIVQFYCYFTNQLLTINGIATGTMFYLVWAGWLSTIYGFGSNTDECDNWCEKCLFPIPIYDQTFRKWVGCEDLAPISTRLL